MVLACAFAKMDHGQSEETSVPAYELVIIGPEDCHCYRSCRLRCSATCAVGDTMPKDRRIEGDDTEGANHRGRAGHLWDGAAARRDDAPLDLAKLEHSIRQTKTEVPPDLATPGRRKRNQTGNGAAGYEGTMAMFEDSARRS